MRTGRKPSRASRLAATKPPGATPATAPPAPWWRDPWALAVALAVVPVLVAMRGGLPGEPVADDFGFLHDSWLRGRVDWLSGGGSPLYWRPLSRQLYYRALGPLVLSDPYAIALLHAALLALAGVLLYRALRPAWPAAAAATVALFPILLDPARQLLAWPSCAQDLLALVFGMASLCSASRGRFAWAAAFLGLALLSKETAIAFAPALVLWPAMRERDGRPVPPAARIRFAAGVGALLVAWWLLHEWVSHRAGLLPPPHAGGAAAALGRSIPWAFRGIWLDAWSARDPANVASAWSPWAGLLILATALAITATNRRGRTRLRAAPPWLGWAAVWTGISTLPLATFMPDWSSHRSVIPAVGLGIALVALVSAAPAAWLGGLVAVRLATLLVSPAPPARIATSGSNVDFDFARLSALQRLAHEVRTTLLRAHPTLPHGARLARNQWPRLTLFAFQDPKAVQVWYRDTTLRVIEMADVRAHPLAPLDAIVEFEPHRTPQVALIDPVALRHVLLAADSLTAGRDEATVALLADFERLQRDTTCAVFMGTGLSVRAAALFELRREDEALADIHRALEYYPAEANVRRLLSEYHRIHGNIPAAIADLRQQLLLYPADAEAARALADLEHGKYD